VAGFFRRTDDWNKSALCPLMYLGGRLPWTTKPWSILQKRKSPRSRSADRTDQTKPRDDRALAGIAEAHRRNFGASEREAVVAKPALSKMAQALERVIETKGSIGFGQKRISRIDVHSSAS
jgi:hypothetical protein